ncbi:amidohydrolase family protein [Allomuricauda sp. SCSIO 65647]|uniref:amidohydrolase family protein n=1 Tax=Allomuricauda sp. SCSIO 65647 TaxID=2908843 RepID=UPI001F485F25|nr:amidohydrolase [Muricauda sp. SCSIO 65647]UJH67817.1 amidohydrolase [Muricauda sp. SCSIO 65647]
MTKVDCIIHNGTVLTINSQMEVFDKGVVVIDKGEILAVGDGSLLSDYDTDKKIDAQRGIVMPGMVNTHCHLPMIAFRGLGEEGIQDRLMGYFMPLEKELLCRELIYDATLIGTMDMALSGITTYADMYYHVDEMARATAKVGLRALLGQTVIGFPVVDAKEPYGGLAYARNIRGQFDKYSRVALALAPHAAYTLSADRLREVRAMSDELDIPIHIHIDEFETEKSKIVDNAKSLSVVRYLEDIGFLADNMILAHCNHVDDEDLKVIKEKGCGIAHNPMANSKGATGTAPIMEAIEKGIPVGLGTDGPMGSNVIDLFKVMTYACTVQRMRKMDRTLMTPDQVVHLATMGGAKVLGLQDQIGSLEKGKQADIVIVETQSLNMLPCHDPYAALVFQANPHNVRTTMVDGQVIMENRVLLTANMEEAKKGLEKWMPKIQALAKNLAIKAKNNSAAI